MMNLYKFEISVNGFLLKMHFCANEESGLKYTKNYISKFQKEVANLEMRVNIYKREQHKQRYNRKPYMFTKALHEKAGMPV
ncbi:hypothetical protein [Paenibacillus xylanilyticus]|uniref:Uncharacterized protein n=1 Tax=Paenibacillus xylanilyticus TaxID=248903 RepID=A0A7Y6BUD4_9BACL|nr:hypothetical protein [Paenibacillus xylanilyticus]NUU74330.1 hypothetical protein [Paenibacillus xylanilyticus]